MAKLKSFNENLTVVHIGNLFRNNGNKDWKIYVWFTPTQNQKWSRFSHLPLLSRGKQVNSTRKQNSKPDRIIHFDQVLNLEKGLLSAFPNLSHYSSIQTKDGEQNSFIYCTENNDRKIRYHIPQLELARALFLINSYFCRSCLSSSALQQDFDVRYDVERDHLEIRVLCSSPFPKDSLEQTATEQLLAWLFSSQNARRSYESIFQHYLKNSYMKTLHEENWCFSFDPPPMAGWKLHVQGRSSLSQEGINYLVEEIVGLEIDAKLPRSTKIIHTAFQELEDGEGPKQYPIIPTEEKTNDEDVELDDDLTADDSNTIRILEADRSWLRFSRPSYIIKQRSSKKRHQTPIEKSNINNSNGALMSTDEPHIGGALPAADLGGKQDETDYNQLFANRFAAVNYLIQVLQIKFQCQILSEETLALPKVGRSRLHLCKDGTPRVIKAIRFRQNDHDFVLIEVDASDAVKMLSTKVLSNVNSEDWRYEFELIRRGVVANSLSWPNSVFNDLYGVEGHRGVNHPKGIGEIGISKEVLAGWAERMVIPPNTLQL